MLLEDIDLVPLYCVQVVIQRQQNQEGPKHGNGGQEVPDIVVIKEVEEDAVAVVLPGLCGGFLPRAQSLEEEEEREAPDHGGADDAEQRDELDPLAAPELREARSRQPGRRPPGPLPALQAPPQSSPKSRAGSPVSLPHGHFELGVHIPTSLNQQKHWLAAPSHGTTWRATGRRPSSRAWPITGSGDPG